jgi:hypothetical protein
MQNKSAEKNFRENIITLKGASPMKTRGTTTLFALLLATTACGTTSNTVKPNPQPVSGSGDSAPEQFVEEKDLGQASGQFLTTVTHNGLSVKLVIDKPTNTAADVLMTFHGTVETDDKIVTAAQKTLDVTKKLITRKDIMFVSVAYPEENLLMGDNIKFAEAALLWVKQKAKASLKVEPKRIFLLGHSQGGYLVTRLNTLHSTDGVIANAPGPLDFKFRCELEEAGKIEASSNCKRMKDKFGSTSENPAQYLERSLLSHLSGFKSRIIFTQGMSDARIQLTSWPKLKEKVKACANCAQAQFEELDGQHGALFSNPKGASIINDFVR